MISSPGIGSGLDVNTIVAQLMVLERRPLDILNKQESGLNTQLSNMGQLNSYTSAMRDKASALTSLTMWNRTTASSSDTSYVTVSSASGAATGRYAVSVQALAAGQTASSRAFASATDTLNEGTLTIELGEWTPGATATDPPTGFTPKDGSTAVSISIGPGETSLEAIRDKINNAGAGVTATIINDANGARLSLRSSETGAENGFRVTATETADDGVAANGLSALVYNPPAAGSQMTRNQAAQNAKATINGIELSSASNTLENVADGLTINLLRETTTAVDVNVTDDTASVKQGVLDFVKAFNDLANYLRTQTAYNAETKTGGVFQGDSSIVGFQRQLRAVLNEESSASDVWATLSDIGISMKSDGTLETNTSKLDAALGDLPELRKLLATDGATTAQSGFMDRFRDLGDSVLGFDGLFETRNASLKAGIERLDDRQAQMEQRLTQTEARLRAQYTALDSTMARLSTLSSYVGQQMAALSANNNG